VEEGSGGSGGSEGVRKACHGRSEVEDMAIAEGGDKAVVGQRRRMGGVPSRAWGIEIVGSSGTALEVVDWRAAGGGEGWNSSAPSWDASTRELS
jgi:hypothetical protein